VFDVEADPSPAPVPALVRGEAAAPVDAEEAVETEETTPIEPVRRPRRTGRYGRPERRRRDVADPWAEEPQQQEEPVDDSASTDRLRLSDIATRIEVEGSDEPESPDELAPTAQEPPPPTPPPRSTAPPPRLSTRSWKVASSSTGRNPKAAIAEVRTGLGTADGLALDPVAQKAYVTDRYNGGKLYKVDLASGGTDWVLDKLGEVNDVALDLPGNRAYVADYGGRRVFTVDLSDHTAPPVVVTDGIRVYGLGLDLAGNRLFACDYARGEVIEFDLSGGSAERKRTWKVPQAAGIALNGGRSYIGQYDRGGLYEIDLGAEGGAPREVATNLGQSVRVALHGGTLAYVCDSTGRLHEVVVVEGENKGLRRVVLGGLGPVCGLALDGTNGRIYVSNRHGKLSRITGALPEHPAES
jgi:DNA-binding beta-propeller fold protein YncE